MKEPLVEPVNDGSELPWASIIAAILAIFVVTVFLVLRSRKKNRTTFLFVGLSEAGKTLTFTKIINKDSDYATYISMKENIYGKFLSINGQEWRLVDYPGAEKLRRGLFDKWLNSELNTLRGIIFVIDSNTFIKKVRDVAELLYDVLFQLKSNNSLSIPVLVACSKQDAALAKSEKAIHEALEREFGLINISRNAALASTDGNINARILTSNGGDFSWSNLKATDLKFLPTSAIENDEYNLEGVRDWIDSH